MRVVLPGPGVPAFFLLPFATLAVFMLCYLSCQLYVAIAANRLQQKLSSEVLRCPYADRIIDPQLFAVLVVPEEAVVWLTNQDPATTKLPDKPSTLSSRKILSTSHGRYAHFECGSSGTTQAPPPRCSMLYLASASHLIGYKQQSCAATGVSADDHQCQTSELGTGTACSVQVDSHYYSIEYKTILMSWNLFVCVVRPTNCSLTALSHEVWNDVQKNQFDQRREHVQGCLRFVAPAVSAAAGGITAQL